MRLIVTLASALCVLSSAHAADHSTSTRGEAEHVVLVVWDGMRADFVAKEYAPNLTTMAASGVRFLHHHSVFPSLTSVNATALATGVFPGRSGMIANWAFRPEISGGKLARMDAPDTVRRGDELRGGKYLGAATIAELVEARGGRTAIAGTKTASLLHRRKDYGHGVTIFAGKAIPESALAAIVNSLGKFPSQDNVPDETENSWTTRALTENLWRDGVPEFSLLWLSDPDRSQHATAPGSNDSKRAIKSSDQNLGLVLDALEAKGVRNKTDVIVASDHGFSTIERAINVVGLLQKQDFDVASETDVSLRKGQVRVAGNGGLNLYYVGAHDGATIARLVETLQQTDFADVIFTREALAGTFAFSAAHMDIAGGPDVVMSFRWSDRRNENGTAGMIYANGSVDENKGTHGTLGPFDLHNTFVAAGPDFRHSMQDDLPTSNLDVAATIMHVLGLMPPEPLDGRVVSEAMTGAATDTPPRVEHDSPTAERQFDGGTWRQTLVQSKLGSSVYLDEGRGGYAPK